MKRLLGIILAALMIIGALASCGTKNDNESGSTSTDTNTDISTNTDTGADINTNTSTNTDTGADINTNTSTDTGASSDMGTDTGKDETALLPSIAEIVNEQRQYYSCVKKEIEYYSHNMPSKYARYKIIKTYDELISVDEETDINESVFAEGYILILDRCYIAVPYHNIGYSGARESEGGLELTLDYSEWEHETTGQMYMAVSLEYLVVPRAELESVSCLEGELTVEYSERNFLPREWFKISDNEAESLENGSVWKLENDEELAAFIDKYGIQCGYKPSVGANKIKLAIYYEAGKNIGIGYSDFYVEGNEAYIVNETVDDDFNQLYYGPIICLITVDKSKISDKEDYSYNIIVLENLG